MADHPVPAATADHAGPAARCSPLGDWTGLPARSRDGRLRLAEIPLLTQVNLRLPAQGPVAEAVARELGVGLPIRPDSTATAGGLTVLWLGPDEWLVLGPPDTDLPDRLAATVGAAGSVVDVSAARTTILVAGPAAIDLLAHGCALDLHPSAFPPGRCAQTMLARSQVILLNQQNEDQHFWVLVRSSFAGYLADWLLDAATEYLR